MRNWRENWGWVLAYLYGVDEFLVTDFAVFVCVEGVVDDAEFLTGQEHAQLRHHLLELQLVQSAIAVAVEALQVTIEM